MRLGRYSEIRTLAAPVLVVARGGGRRSTGSIRFALRFGRVRLRLQNERSALLMQERERQARIFPDRGCLRRSWQAL